MTHSHSKSTRRLPKTSHTSQVQAIDKEKRRFLIATTTVGALGMAFVAVPFIKSMTPTERAKTAAAPVEVDISKIAPGGGLAIEWRGQPVWILNRTEKMLSELQQHNAQLADPQSEVTSQQPTCCANASRSIKPNIAVLVGICTHLGCSPILKPQGSDDMGNNWSGGFFCPCHGSKFDLAGRVFKGSPAPVNLVVPPYRYLSDTALLIGDNEDKKA